jgi:hypothetical protein
LAEVAEKQPKWSPIDLRSNKRRANFAVSNAEAPSREYENATTGKFLFLFLN